MSAVPFFTVMLLTTILTFIGFLLLVIPGVIIMLMLFFAGYIVIDKGLGGVESLKASKNLVSGYKGKLFGFLFVLGLLNLAGFLALGVGLLVTVPISSVAAAFFYRNLAPRGY